MLDENTGLLRLVQATMPDPRPWADDPHAGEERVIAAIWMVWIEDVIAHRTARKIRANSLTHPRRQTAKEIRDYADAADPFVKKGADCDLCEETFLALLTDSGIPVHYHRKEDGAVVPLELLKGCD